MAAWLLLCCAMVFAMVVIGGITRLTWSGLSITEWQPVTGAVPPLSDAAWQAEFAKYRQSAQYRLLNTGMSLADFKTIYLWEYVHRLWGRLIGCVYLLPFLYFLARGRIPRHLAWPLAGIFALGAAQGALGWWMVKSGLADRIEVSQYRLTAHLALALLIYTATLWAALNLFPSPVTREREGLTAQRWEGEGRVGESTPTVSPYPALSRRSAGGEGETSSFAPGYLRRAAEGVLALVALTVVAGGFVAGLNAGLTYNTFPLMDGNFVPAGYAQMTPWWRNWFENVAAVQFDHRLLAETTVVSVVALWFAGRLAKLPQPARRALHVLLALALLQLSLGVSTLLLVVPIPLAAAHQAGAVLLLTAAIVLRHRLRARPSFRT
ncbi:MAG: COX15/CtaA family protein [Alphaproteobacteria bacterium]|nr:COX15/CtaA family protein [Alphaproteobacteria bacterium]